jgi:hypothetical protein
MIHHMDNNTKKRGTDTHGEAGKDDRFSYSEKRGHSVEFSGRFLLISKQIQVETLSATSIATFSRSKRPSLIWPYSCR